jgi:hypothetical protein
MPFQAFYRHALKTAMHAPFERPVATTVIRKLGKVIKDDIKDQVAVWGFDMDKEVPTWEQDSLPVELITLPDGSHSMRMLNTKGPNPLSLISDQDPGANAFANLNPLLKVGIETLTGVDLFKMKPITGPGSTFTGMKVDPDTGQVVRDIRRKNPVENMLQQFWPYKTLEKTIAGGRQPHDTTTLLDMLTGDPDAYKRDPLTGTETRAPGTRVEELLRPVASPTQYVQHPTKEQRRGQQAVAREQINKMWQRATPAERVRIRRELAKARYGGALGIAHKTRPHH